MEPVIKLYSNFNGSLDDQTIFTNPLNGDDIQWKMTLHINSGISQQPLIGLYSNYEPKIKRPNHILQIL